MAAKSIIQDLNSGNKFDGDNYNVWHRKVRMVLEEQEVEETLLSKMTKPDENDAKDPVKVAAFENWLKKDRKARITLLSCMHDDFLEEYHDYSTAYDLWEALKAKFGGMSATRLRELNIRFDGYKMREKHTMKQHLRIMSNMIRELKDGGIQLSDEQQISAVVRSLPNSWKYMKAHMIHNPEVKNFENIRQHLELEAECMEADKPVDKPSEVFVAESSSQGGHKPKKGKGAARSYAPKTAATGGISKKKRGKRGAG